MKKSVFGIVATMLLVGTMAFMSCSDDSVFGYDEEWDDMIPRTKFNINDQPDDEEYYDWSLGNECLAQALAQFKGWSTSSVTIEQYHELVCLIMNLSPWTPSIQSSYAADVTNPSSPGFTLTESRIMSLFNCNTSTSVSGHDFGSSAINYTSAVGERNIGGVPHIDFITKYRPADYHGWNTHPAQFYTKNDGWVDVSEFSYLHSILSTKKMDD